MSSNLHEKVDRLNDHIQAELDILGVVDDALKVSKDDEVRAKLAEFRRAHERHAERLRGLVLGAGGAPTSHRDLIGVMMGASAKIGAHSDASGLRIFRRDLERTASRYEGSLFDELRPEVREAFEEILAEDRAQMAWLDQTLHERGWEEIPPPWPIP